MWFDPELPLNPPEDQPPRCIDCGGPTDHPDEQCGKCAADYDENWRQPA
jgi:hypothetical protein